MATLTIGASGDWTKSPLYFIDTIVFTNPAPTTAVALFAGKQFGLGRIAPDVEITGSGGINAITIATDFRGLDASGWRFVNWGPGDRIVINGSSAGETLTGSSQRDTIRGGAGHDTISGGGGNDTIIGGSGMDQLDGGGGTDTLSYAGSVHAVFIDLALNRASGGDATGDTISGFENVTGGAGNDRITGNAAANVLTGRLGADILTGGLGADRFVYTALNQSPAGDGRDQITDFSPVQRDRIVLAAIDAVAGGGDDAFDFIGGDEFTAVGQLRVVREGLMTLVQADANGDGLADLEIALTGLPQLTAADFIL